MPRSPRSARLLVLMACLVALPACSTVGDGIAAPTPAGAPAQGAMAPLSITRDGEVIATFSVEVADSPDERAIGLMGRTDLAAGTGMAFLFDRPEAVRFWMKDTLIPLSIAFWDASGTIVAILEMQPCAADPCPTYGPDVPVVGALEVEAGALSASGVAVGDLVVLVGASGR